ncbi:CRTAC1 family protein [Echinimonas agarilytica]|uniref:CRTAC1 family protein n=1 Tax=Echinimonas agarilytica TaxID=1215918 RepID=A0AA41W4X5_9GAMM|nr:CRTAC1 family protein [Echinimonas agarilytica]MCM2678527.1 CRTAC1 family protein [Echinimonas agarilytica]
MEKAVFLIAGLSLVSCSSEAVNSIEPSKPVHIKFAEANQDFAKENKDRRKWDAPVVADLDQDGYSDLIINDHGYGIRVMWNNQGKLAKPYDLIMGDIHGVAVGDIDQDGLLEVIVSRGGGSGSNARNAKIFRAHRDRTFSALAESKTPLALMRGRTLKLFDLDNDGDLDLVNFAFPSKERRGASESYIYGNDGKGNFTVTDMLPPVRSDGQKTKVTDFNNDLVPDLLLYGHGSVKAFEGQGDLTFKPAPPSVLPQGIKHVTGIVEFDYDNDGDFDLFISRGKPFTAGETFYNPETQKWALFTMRGKFDFELKVGDTLAIENLQTPWPHSSFYAGESAYDYTFKGETHSGRNTTLVSSNALGFPDKQYNKGLYIGYIGNEYWKVAGDIFSQATVVLGNVKNAPSYEIDPGMTDMLLENQNGVFVDVSEKVGIDDMDRSSSVTVADIDNNGYQDLIVSHLGTMVFDNPVTIWQNLASEGQARHFKQAQGHQLISSDIGAFGLGIDSFDYDLDGHVDVVIGNERGKWHLFANQANADSVANFLTVELPSSHRQRRITNGAIVKVTACGVTQQRRMGSTGAAYSSSFDRFIHFGLGQCDTAATIDVLWSDGGVSQVQAKQLNRIVAVN